MKHIVIITTFAAIISMEIFAEHSHNNQTIFEEKSWNYTQATLHEYIQHTNSFITPDELTVKDSTFLLAAPLATFFLYLWGHQISDCMRERGIDDHRAYLAALSVISYIGIIVINHLIETLSDAFNTEPQRAYAALHDYRRAWQTHQEVTPTLLKNFFEQLFYNPDGHTITQEEALTLFKAITQTADTTHALVPVLDHLSKSLLLPQINGSTSTEPHQNRPSLMQALQLNACQSEQPEKIKWEYVLSQLNILKQPSLLQTWSNTINHYQWPIVFGFGTPLGILINTVMRNHYAEQISSTITRYISLLLGFSGITLFTKLFGTEDNHEQDRLHDALEFIDNWDYHKAYTPRCLHGLFEKLHQLFIKHHQQLNFHELFIDELYKMIAEIWMYAAQPKKIEPA